MKQPIMIPKSKSLCGQIQFNCFYNKPLSYNIKLIFSHMHINKSERSLYVNELKFTPFITDDYSKPLP